METQSTLGFKLPERTAVPADSFLLDLREVSIWVSSLPVANVGETSRQVFKTIVEFNRLEISGLTRLKVAELFHRPIRYIADNLRKYYYDTPFPLSAKNRKIAVLNRELYAELALAYKVFIEEAISAKSGKIDRKLLIIAIHRVMRSLSQVIYQSVIVYDPIPETVWKEIHRLYAYAEQNNIHNFPVKEADKRDGHNSAISIAELYKQILLLSISSPYRLRQREIDSVKSALNDWGKLVSLERPADTSLTPFQFVARLSSDAPPLHHALETKELSQHCRVLNAQTLVQSLKESFDNLPTDGDRHEIQRDDRWPSRHLLRQMIKIFSSEPKREFVRTKLNFELKIAVGITAIHSLLTAEGEPEAVKQPPPEGELDWVDTADDGQSSSLYTLRKQKLTLDGFDESIQETIVASGIGDSSFGIGGAPTWTSNQIDRQHETFSCKTDNESAGGYCINWQGANAPKIKIGEVIGIQSAVNRNQFSIGISRWLRNQPSLGLQVGMQMTSPNATAVLIHYFNDADQANTPQRGLLLPELKSSGQPASLVLPTLPFKVGDLLLVRQNDHEHKIELTHLMESTGAFTQFQFTYLTKYPNDEMDQTDINNTDFENIWPML